MPFDPKKHLIRFNNYVGAPDANGCANWTGGTSSRGYGVFWADGKSIASHRLAWMMANEQEIPNGLFICHRCDNPRCVNPDHLFLGTPSENIIDCIQKGRKNISRGANRWKAVLNDESVRAILRLHQQGKPGNAIAREYGVAANTIYAITSRRNWKHVSLEEAQ